MSDRHQILDDHESSWTRLEHDAFHWLEASDDNAQDPDGAHVLGSKAE